MAANNRLKARVEDVLKWVSEIAPFESAEKWDNVGLLCGCGSRDVSRVLCALDLTEGALNEAERLGAELIVTHHPIMFSGRKHMREDDPEGRLICRMIRANMSLIAAHTNYDMALGGVNDCLARALGLENIEPVAAEEGSPVRIGDIPPETLSQLAERVSRVLGDVVRVYGDKSRAIRRVAVCGGAGGEYASLALNAGAQAYITGEMRYHDSLELMALGLCTLSAGHDATERIAIKPLADGLQKRAYALQYSVEVFVSDMGVVK